VSPDPREYDYSHPTRNCDIVMKGGITSGVVYPHAVCELAQTYRFKSVGGTSAGAIAAAATAAAEYGRYRDGFGVLARLPEWIGTGDNLQSLFQPEPSTRRLHRILLAGVDRGPVAAVRSAIRAYPLALLIGLVPGIVIVVLGLTELAIPLAVATVILGLLTVVAGGALALFARMARQVMRTIPDNHYGLCSGHRPWGETSREPLTTWLGNLIERCAGREPYGDPLISADPLTFGDLWAGPNRAAPPDDPADRFVQLEMMTTNLTNRWGYRLPRETREWFFDPAEMRGLFPEPVVRWMERHPAAESDGPTERQRTRMQRALLRPLCPMPDPHHLPVVVATRLSLSFPVLLSAVPLWRVDMTGTANADAVDEWREYARAQGKDWNPLVVPEAEWPAAGRPASKPRAERCLFSDGGIASNFPVHFFDRLIPRWPTFAINLRPYHPDRPHEHVRMVEDNTGGIEDWWYRAPARPDGLWPLDKRLFAFLSGVVRTMQNRVDEANMRMPGYRDRVAHVSMSSEEGGMNLAMPKPVLDKLTARGREAGEILLEAYTAPPSSGRKITWDNHRWVRFRSALAVLEQMHARMAVGYRHEPEHPDEERSYPELFAAETPPSYDWTGPTQRELAGSEVEGVLALDDAVTDSGASTTTDAPKPAPEGRIVPSD
jgi:hypothetical protein